MFVAVVDCVVLVVWMLFGFVFGNCCFGDCVVSEFCLWICFGIVCSVAAHTTLAVTDAAPFATGQPASTLPPATPDEWDLLICHIPGWL